MNLYHIFSYVFIYSVKAYYLHFSQSALVANKDTSMIVSIHLCTLTHMAGMHIVPGVTMST